MIEVRKIQEQADLLKAFAIRKEVFVKEQNVPAEEEYDQYEQESTHFLAFYENQPCGTARWRFTEKGIKLERFAVLAPYRNKKVGKKILESVLQDVQNNSNSDGKIIYLHAQVQVIGFYEKFGFEKFGEMFQECE
ncbi:MAG: GNAT family N-acetyltransferase, partial [Raineya sp.]|nr:GNAT family N-acetyltransferase [Raineya sp.]